MLPRMEEECGEGGGEMSVSKRDRQTNTYRKGKRKERDRHR